LLVVESARWLVEISASALALGLLCILDKCNSFRAVLYARGLKMGSNLMLAVTFRAVGLQKGCKSDEEPMSSSRRALSSSSHFGLSNVDRDDGRDHPSEQKVMDESVPTQQDPKFLRATVQNLFCCGFELVLSRWGILPVD